MKKVIQGGTIINEGRQFQADLVIEGGKITQILAQAPETLLQEAQVIDASHCFVIPGVIDDQVHFREPGLTHKGNIGEGSRAAAAGGVTYGYAQCRAANHYLAIAGRETGDCRQDFISQLFFLSGSYNG